MNPSIKPLVYFFFGGLLLGLFSVVIWIAVNGPHANVLFGRVVDVTSSTITVADQHGEQTVVAIATSTTVMRKRDELQVTDLVLNNFVQITLTKDEEVIAESIRVMRPPRDINNHDPRQ